MKKINNNIKILVIALVMFLILFMACFLFLGGLTANNTLYNTFLFTFFVVICSSSKKALKFFIVPIGILFTLYIPVSITYGVINGDFLLAAFSTDLLESREFFRQVPYENYLYVLAIYFIYYIYYRYTNIYNISLYRNKFFIIISLTIIIFPQEPLLFVRQISEAVINVKNEYERLKSLHKEPSWSGVVRDSKQYKTYVIVIGESARKDYHQAYGYPIKNTPFMNNTKGIVIEGLTAGGTSTVPSLTKMLTYEQEKSWSANYEFNIISLFKLANMTTYWLSNQGYLGAHDTPISVLARLSDETYFLKYGDYSSKNTSDFQLLSNFLNVLDQKNDGDRVIVLHLYGAHPDACDRVDDYSLITSVSNDYYAYLNCYVSSIHKTDTFLKIVYEALSDRYRLNTIDSFSMIYFSDHGLAHRDINNVLYFNNNQLSKYHYEIPLFKISSDDTERKECRSFKSGLNFTNGIANWMGIKADQLDPNYSLFDCQDDPSDFGLSEKIKEGVDDPAIDITGK